MVEELDLEGFEEDEEDDDEERGGEDLKEPPPALPPLLLARAVGVLTDKPLTPSDQWIPTELTKSRLAIVAVQSLSPLN